MPIIELIDYTLESEGSGNGLADISFSLFQGDAYSIQADAIEDAAIFLKALATRVLPIKGTYVFNDVKIDLSDYRNSLKCKQRMGYIASDAGIISNRTIRENLLFMRCFHEDSLSLTLDDHTADLCRRFDLSDKLDLKPGELHARDVKNTIVIRELCKSPDVMILERPEDFVDHTKFELFIETLKRLTKKKLPLIFYSTDADFVTTFSNKKITISRGKFKAALL